MSNALLVGGAHTQTGHRSRCSARRPPTHPQLLVEKDCTAPASTRAAAAFAGTDIYVQLGRGRFYGGQRRSASGDNNDEFVLLLCEPGGGPPSVDSLGYLRNGVCEPIERYQHEQTAKPSAGGEPGVQESGSQCANNIDDDGDGLVNDAAPRSGLPEVGPQCLNDTDDDGDGAVNDGCPPIAATTSRSRGASSGPSIWPAVARGKLIDGTPIAVAGLRSTYRNELGSARGSSTSTTPDFMAIGYDSSAPPWASGVGLHLQLVLHRRPTTSGTSTRASARSGRRASIRICRLGRESGIGRVSFRSPPSVRPRPGRRLDASWKQTSRRRGSRPMTASFGYGPTYRSRCSIDKLKPPSPRAP